ncbi:MAG TPA: AGE family epimerase/isomerase [Acidobacteriaceae bacterium]|nr:AGE family epimerase/isomerase [Acidobacteriaceae bacterium]
MKRRQFLLRAAAAGTTQMVAGGMALRAAESSKRPREADAELLGYSLSQLRDLYHRDLFDDWLPFMERHVLDPEYGGFLCNTDFDGTHTNMEKEPLFEGRGIWVYSSLYMHFGKDPRYLEVARRSVDLLSKSQPEKDVFWCTTIHRDGSPSSPPGRVIPTDIAVAEGYAAYAQATGQQQYLDRAKQLLHKCVEIYDRPDYNPTVGSGYFGATAPAFPGARIMGSSMIMLRTAAQILEMDSDPAVDRLARRCADAVVRYHFNPEFQLNNELLHHDYSRPADVYGQLSNLGNTLEMTWMLLDEATRQRDEAMFRVCVERFERHAEVAWDRVYGGVFHNLLNVDENRLELNKLLWAQEETLIDTLYIYDRTSAAWAAEMFGRMYKYVRERYPLTAHGSPIWMYATGRKATFEEFSGLRKRIENYHHPRHLIHNLRRLDAMVARSSRRPV